jgi:hypothetical protein
MNKFNLKKRFFFQLAVWRRHKSVPITPARRAINKTAQSVLLPSFASAAGFSPAAPIWQLTRQTAGSAAHIYIDSAHIYTHGEPKMGQTNGSRGIGLPFD